MPPQTTDPSLVRPGAAVWNERIRVFVRGHGDRPWGRGELVELARLRAEWQAAVAEEAELAA